MLIIRVNQLSHSRKLLKLQSPKSTNRLPVRNLCPAEISQHTFKVQLS